MRQVSSPPKGLADIEVFTDGGPWASHNMPCPVCKEKHAMMYLDGWVFHPCEDCERQGWRLVKLPRWLTKFFTWTRR